MTEQIGLGSDPGTICLQPESEECTCKLLSTRMFLTDQIHLATFVKALASTYICGSRKFCQRGSNFDRVFYEGW